MKVIGDLNFIAGRMQNAIIDAQSSAPSTPVEGQIYYDSTDYKIKYYNGVEWVAFRMAFPLNPNKSNLLFWYEASSGVTKDGSNLVSQWNDRSGNGYHLTQGTGANQPLWNAMSSNELPGIYFDGSNDYLENSGVWTWGNTNTIYLVSKRTSNLDNLNGPITSHGSNSPAISQGNTTGNYYVDSNGSSLCATAVTDNVWCVWTAVWDSGAGQVALRKNNSAATSAAATFNTGTGLYVGIAVTGHEFNGEICEIIGYSVAHNTTQQDQMLAYFNEKYAIY